MNLLKLPEEEKKDTYPEEEAVIGHLRARSRRIRPELVMGIVALLAAALLAAVLIPSLPYMFRDEDP